jgi:hypothetical protein
VVQAGVTNSSFGQAETITTKPTITNVSLSCGTNRGVAGPVRPGANRLIAVDFHRERIAYGEFEYGPLAATHIS